MTGSNAPSPRILLLFTEVHANGGIQRFNRTLLAALTEIGARCDVLSMHDRPDRAERTPPPANPRVTGFAGNRGRFALAAVAALWRERYDFVVIGHVNLLTLAMAAIVTHPLRTPQAILIAHGIEVWYGIGRQRQRAFRRLDSVLCVSRFTRQRILEQVPRLEPERLRIFPNALGEGWTEAPGARRLHGVSAPFLLSVTRLEKGDRYKGIVTVIETLSMLADTALQYVVVGHGRDRAFLERVAERFGVGERVHFLRGIDDEELTDLYRRCEAFVLPSGKEGFGIVFLEAMFYGAPVIAAAEKGALDVVSDEVNGLLIPFGDSLALKRAVERLRSDEALRERLRAAGRALVTGEGPFTFRRFVARSAEAIGVSEVCAA